MKKLRNLILLLLSVIALNGCTGGTRQEIKKAWNDVGEVISPSTSPRQYDWEKIILFTDNNTQVDYKEAMNQCVTAHACGLLDTMPVLKASAKYQWVDAESGSNSRMDAALEAAVKTALKDVKANDLLENKTNNLLAVKNQMSVLIAGFLQKDGIVYSDLPYKGDGVFGNTITSLALEFIPKKQEEIKPAKKPNKKQGKDRYYKKYPIY